MMRYASTVGQNFFTSQCLKEQRGKEEFVLLPWGKVMFTARKRSLGQGNVFTPVSQSFCSQWPPKRAVRILLECILVSQVFVHGGGSLYDVNSCLTAWFHIPSGGGGVSVRGSLCPGGLCRETPPNQKSGRYATYSNTFLLTSVDNITIPKIAFQ